MSAADPLLHRNALSASGVILSETRLLTYVPAARRTEARSKAKHQRPAHRNTGAPYTQQPCVILRLEHTAAAADGPEMTQSADERNLKLLFHRNRLPSGRCYRVHALLTSMRSRIHRAKALREPDGQGKVLKTSACSLSPTPSKACAHRRTAAPSSHLSLLVCLPRAQLPH